MTETDLTEYEISEKIKDICFSSRKSWFKLANLSLDKRNLILTKLIEQLKKDKEIIDAANIIDIENAKKIGMSSAIIDRLTINDKRFNAIIEGIQQIIKLPDPLGITLNKYIRPDKMEISKITVPIGVIALIYESRPNVTIEASALTIKSGNVVILKGGKEAYHSNSAFSFSLQETLKSLSLPKDIVTFFPFKERSATLELLQQKDKIDLVIPRGGEGLIDFVTKNSLIPVIKHYKGLCHTFIDMEANFEKAIKIAINAKVQRPGVCNAMETLLIHENIAKKIIPPLFDKYKEYGVTIKGCIKTREIYPNILEASDKDFDTEHLDKILSVKIVENVDDAICHIEKHGSRHSEAIITENKLTSAKFIQNVDASAVFVNASTRFNDGFEFGLGAEMGISTDKLHARGPMGLNELTTYKYVVLGNGHIRE